MLVLDTNVVAEVMRPGPDDHVRAWLDGQATSRLFVTTITKAEIRQGIARLPEGKRKASLAATAGRVFHELFRGRVFAFDTEAADAYAVISADREAAGHLPHDFGLPDRRKVESTRSGYHAHAAVAVPA